LVACPRNQQVRTTLAGGIFVCGEGKDAGQCSDENEVAFATLNARMNFDVIN